MHIRKQLAWALTKRLYRSRVVGDVPRSRLFYYLVYGSVHKLRNYWRARADYHAHRLTARGRPSELRVEPTTACNLHCPLCPTGAGELDRPRALMPLDTYESVLDQLAAHLFFVHLWVWGEPLLHRDLARMIAMAEERGVGTEISTNLSIPLTDTDIDRLITAGLSWIIVSADAASAETYQQYRIGGDFDLVCANVRRIAARKRALRSLTPFIEWQFVPFRHNEHELDRVDRFAASLGADGVRIKPARIDKTNGRTFDGAMPGDLADQWLPSRPEFAHLLNPATQSFTGEACPFLYRSITLHPDAGVALCCETYKRVHDVRNGTADIDNLWNSPGYMTARGVASGRYRGPDYAHVACQGCKVFVKPLAPVDLGPQVPAPSRTIPLPILASEPAA